MIKYLLYKILLSFSFLAISFSVAYGQTTISGSVSGTWTKAGNPYILDGVITVPTGQILTIEAGVIVQLPRYDRRINVYGTLLAQGTVTDSIRFEGIADTGYTGESTHGGGIYFYSGSSASLLNYVSIDLMGDVSYGGAAISIIPAEIPTVKNTAIRHSEANDVITWAGGTKNFSNVKAIVGVTSGTVEIDATMSKLGFATSFYRLLNSITVNTNTKLTIEPGVKIEFPRYDRSINVYGTILAQGTVTDSIRFEGKADTDYTSASTHGGSIYFYSGSSASQLDHVSIDLMGDASYAGAAISIISGETPTVKNTAIRHSEASDVSDVITWAGGTKNFSSIKAIVGIISGTGEIDATMAKLGFASSFYRLLNSITVNANYKLTIEPGVKIEFPRYDRSIIVNGTLLAQGTVNDSIRFQGKADTDYTSASTHGGGIYFYFGSSASVLNFVSINLMGDVSTVGTAISIITGVTPTIKNLSVTNSESNDIVSWAGGGQNFSNIKAIVGINTGTGDFNATMAKLGYNSFYKLLNGFTVSNNYKLTLNPGVVIHSLIYTDQLLINGTLIAKGTAADSIRFIGFANPGYAQASTHGGQINFSASSTGSELEYVAIDRWGDLDYLGSAIAIYTSGVTISNSAIRNSENLAVNIAYVAISPTISAVRFEKNGKDIQASLSSVSNIHDCANTKVYLRSEATEASCTVSYLGSGSFYIMPGGDVTVTRNTTTTIMPGVQIHSLVYTDKILVNGTLIAKGTAADSIRFTGFANPGYNQASTHGGQINFATSSTGSQLEYVVIDRWGDVDYHGSAVAIYSSGISISKSAIRNGETTGINIASASLNPTISAVQFKENGKDIQASPSSVSGIHNCPDMKIYLRSEFTETSCTIPNPGNGSYYIMSGGDVTVTRNTIMTIMPGVQIRSLFYTDKILVNGTLIAKGTAADSIRFTGFANPNYAQASTHGGQINFVASSNGSELEYVAIDRWGDVDYHGSAVAIYSSGVSISKSAIRNSEITGINIASTSISPTISAVGFEKNGKDIHASPSSVSEIHDCPNTKIYLRSEFTETSCTIPNPGNSSYYIMPGGDVTVTRNTTMTIMPGVQIHSLVYSDKILVNGTLIAKGTAVDSIRFIGFANPASAQASTHGGQINFVASSSGSVLEYVAIDRWGDVDYHGSAVAIYTSEVSVKQSTIRNSENIGIQILSEEISPVISSNNFTFNSKDISTYPGSISGVLNNKNGKIYINSGNTTANATWPFPGVSSYYILNGTINISRTYTLTIEAGSLINTGNNSPTINVYGTLRAIGTEAAPIQFTKLELSNASRGEIYLHTSSSNSVLDRVSLNQWGNIYALYVATNDFSIANISVSYAANYGLYYTGNGNNIISGSSFFNNKTGVYVQSGRPTFNACNIYGNTDFGIYNASTVAADSVDARSSYWGDKTGPFHEFLNNSGLGNKVSDKVSFIPWKLTPQQGQVTDIGISAILSPKSDCNHTSIDSLKVSVSNYGNVSLTTFQISYRINGSSAIMENVSNVNLLPGRSIDYTFASKINLASPGSYKIDVFTTITADTINTNNALSLTIESLQGISSPVNLSPITNSANINIPVVLTWAAVPGAVDYDLYIWKAADPAPSQPVIVNLTQIAYSLSTNMLAYGTNYKWKVVAKRFTCRAESMTMSFSTLQLPDLIVESISVPVTATSETEIVINWKIKNEGQGGTGSTAWTDLIYLSDQPVLNTGTDNFYVGHIGNFSALNPGQSYQSGSLTYKLPQGIQGNYYVTVQTNSSHSLEESPTTNNQRVSTPINVSLVPPPDLQITALTVAPLSAFSEDEVTVTYTVTNKGIGPTSASNWADQILIGSSETLNPATDISLYYHYVNQPLAANGTYTVSKKIQLPARIHGTYFIHLITDRGNAVYEYNHEDNNSNTTLPITIFQRPTPNLIISAISTSSAAASNNQPVTVNWTTANEGVLIAKPNWNESIYLSPNQTFNPSQVQLLGSHYRADSLQSLAESNAQEVVLIPSNTGEGDYYFFVKTDSGNRIYENPSEEDNVSVASSKIHVVNSDLLPISFTAPATAFSEQNVDIQYRVKNDSQAGIYNSSWTDRIYLSTDNSFGPSDLLLATSVISQLLPASAEYSKQTSFTLPVGISGNYYFILVSNADQSVFEKIETNNIKFMPVTITLAPWPDLLVSTINAPEVDTSGTSINLHYTIKNSGEGAIVNTYWIDKIYLSPTSTVSEANLVYLGSVGQTRSLSKDQSFTQQVSFQLPDGLSGIYYIVIQVDANRSVFENTAKGNNIQIAPQPTTVVTLPAIDFSVSGAQILSSTVTAGQPINIQWTVKNNSSFQTIVPSWTDGVYLSNNPVLDASDTQLSTLLINTPVPGGASYTKNLTVTIPQQASGILYVLLIADLHNQNHDDNRNNNTLALTGSGGGQAVTIVMPPPADLVPLSVTAPASGTVSQPITISFTVRNNGSGPTPSNIWTDNLYLSTDTQEGSDIYLASLNHNGNLAAGAEYVVTEQVFLPADITGNYVLLLKTDAGNNVFERGNEANNLAFTNIFINPQQPSDLVVTELSLPMGEQYAGENVSLSWVIANKATNTATGYIREAIYFSKDTIADISDVLFGTLESTLYLPSLATIVQTLQKPLANLTIGDYYVIVKTDILNNIQEQNEDNNNTVSLSKITVAVKELPLNVATSADILKDVPLYYRLVIPATLANETLSIVLKGDSVNNVINRLFIRKDSIPTANRFDHTANVAFQTNQELIIPALQTGTYYLMGLGNNIIDSKEPVSLIARIIPFSIKTVDANKGGNTGLVTIRITGAKFEPGMTISLTGHATLTASNVYFIDPSKVFATFNLSGTSLGNYTVQLRKTSGVTAQLVNGFEIITGTPGGAAGAAQLFTCNIQNIGFDENIGVEVIHPATVRRNQKVKMTVAYINTGNVDIPAQTRVLLSLEGAPINFIPDFTRQPKELLLEFVEADGPPGILRAGSSGYINFYTYAIAPISLIITQ